MKDVKIETMRSRGAGGQVRLPFSSPLPTFPLLKLIFSLVPLPFFPRTARQPNRIRHPSHPRPHRRLRLNARLSIATREPHQGVQGPHFEVVGVEVERGGECEEESEERTGEWDG